MATNRRDFLLGSLASGAALPFAGLAPRWLAGAGNLADDRKKLVVLEIEGGWDYFNQIVPVNEPVYYSARPTSGIGIADGAASTLPIAASVPQKWAISMQPFRDLYDRGDLAIVHNVGYPNPSLSHFESIKKWHAGDPSATTVTEGWLARYLLRAYTGGFSLPALDVAPSQSAAFTGAKVALVADLSQFGLQFDGASWEDNAIQRSALWANTIMLRAPDRQHVQLIADRSRSAIEEAALLGSGPGSYTPRVVYPVSKLADDFKTIARYIAANLQTHVYYVRSGGLDNHSSLATPGSGHTGTFANLMRNITGCVKAFLDDMRAWNRGPDVVVMLFSEFGRRFGQNGSLGTDHGHGSVAYLAGDPVIGGVYGKYPNLSTASSPYYNYYPPFNNDSVDFRSLYATVLQRWLQVPSTIVLGQQFPLLGAL
jgi:uncharacterized protein (DUF1501 family)